MGDVKLLAGGSLEDDANGFLDAWHRSEHGEEVSDARLYSKAGKPWQRC